MACDAPKWRTARHGTPPAQAESGFRQLASRTHEQLALLQSTVDALKQKLQARPRSDAPPRHAILT